MVPSELTRTLRQAVSLLEPHREALVEAWSEALQGLSTGPREELRELCEASLARLFRRLSAGDLEALLGDEAEDAAETAQRGESLRRTALSIRALDRCCLPHLIEATGDREELGELLLALDELGDRRLEVLVQAQEEETARRLIEAQEQVARVREKAREVRQANEALKAAQAESQHRADQIGLVSSVTRRIASILDPDRLMQEAAEAIQTRANHTYVAVVVVDHEGVLVGRWAGRPGVGRRSSGRAQGPAGGVIGRALRKKAPQVVMDVEVDPDYHADVPGTRSEMAVPLIENGDVIGALDFQNERPGAFDLDDVAAGEAIAEFLVVALRNARLFAASREKRESR
jgi:putative methionine-R-sulfoxide reductase with GAF domain